MVQKYTHTKRAYHFGEKALNKWSFFDNNSKNKYTFKEKGLFSSLKDFFSLR